MNQLTLKDVINHAQTCGTCAHLKSETHKYTKALLQKAIVAAHSKPESRTVGYGPVCSSNE
jgi:hypothetical protein